MIAIYFVENADYIICGGVSAELMMKHTLFR